jgi:hypothetical protein
MPAKSGGEQEALGLPVDAVVVLQQREARRAAVATETPLVAPQCGSARDAPRQRALPPRVHGPLRHSDCTRTLNRSHPAIRPCQNGTDGRNTNVTFFEDFHVWGDGVWQGTRSCHGE